MPSPTLGRNQGGVAVGGPRILGRIGLVLAWEGAGVVGRWCGGPGYHRFRGQGFDNKVSIGTLPR